MTQSITYHRTKTCADCGERFRGPENRQYCKDCFFKHGTVYVYDMKKDKWIKEER